ncbi:MAG: DNA polymerase III subunit delta, partial [Gammaproteobacteria bacterium]
AAPPPDALLLVTAPGAERKTANTAWAKAAAKTGVLVECRPLKSEQMPDWIAARLRDRRLQVPPEGARLIAEYAQGTLFAAAQAIERLTLIVPEGRADLATVREAVVDEARYGTFECVDAALAGDAAGALRMMVRLAETGTVPPQILWVVARELRVLESWCWAAEHGGPRPNVWDSRRNLVATAARRRSVRGWQALVIAAAEVDRAIKGRAPGDAWVLLERLLLAIASAPLAEAA